MSRILVISFSNLAVDVRVRRQLFHLRDHYDVTAVGHVDHGITGVGFLKVPPPGEHSLGVPRRILSRCCRALKWYDHLYWTDATVRTAFAACRGQRWDLIIANDLDTLPLAARLSRRARGKSLVDLHEWEPGRNDHDDQWRRVTYPYVDYLCRNYLPRVDGGMTVCQSISELYQQHYGVQLEVHTNMPFFSDLTPTPVDPKSIRLVYHGGVNRSRRLENLFAVLERLDARYELSVIPVGTESDIARLKHAADGSSRVHFVPPVESERVPAAINQYDIGLFPLYPLTTSYRLALPNKFFEFIQARLGIAIWPTPEMASLLRRHGLGVVTSDFSVSQLAETMNSLTVDQIAQFKQNAHQVADTYCAEKNRERLLATVKRLLAGPVGERSRATDDRND